MKLNTILWIGALIAVSAVILTMFTAPDETIEVEGQKNNTVTDNTVKVTELAQLDVLTTEDEVKDFIEDVQSSQENFYGFFGDMIAMPMMAADGEIARVATTATTTSVQAESSKAAVDDFSTTNVQVEGVDEADRVKTDGNYIYTLSGNILNIVSSYPAEQAEVVSTIELEYANEFFINDGKLVVFGSKQYEIEAENPQEPEITGKMVASDMIYYPRHTTKSYIQIYDISDRENPELSDEVIYDGYYVDSRMIGEQVYAIYNFYPQNDIIIPLLEVNGAEISTRPNIYYFDDINYKSPSITKIVSLNVDTLDVDSQDYMLDSSSNIFVSQENIYLSYQQYFRPERNYLDIVKDIVPNPIAQEIEDVEELEDTPDYEKNLEITAILSRWSDDLTDEEEKEFEEALATQMEEYEKQIAKESEKTVVHKINIDDGDISYVDNGLVPGHVLNQFSMDEYDGFFRIATTTGRVSRSGQSVSANHIYVLDENMDTISSVEDLAPGERIYSARFMGERAYLVTFKKVDPLFVIDLSNPYDPVVLGKLKIPGYSDYLHPYDENHLIGIGKDTVEAEEGDFAWYQGIKMALFDVSDPENPIEKDVVIIGDRGSDSDVLRDHKAFLFSKERNLLVLPVLIAEIDEEKYSEVRDNQYGDFVYQGAQVYHIDDQGFTLRGSITHIGDDSLEKSGYYYRSDNMVTRSLYVQDTLYTISSGKIKANDLDTLEEIKSVDLEYDESEQEYWY